MQIRDTIDSPSTASTEGPPEDVIVLVDSAGVALGVRQAFSAKVRAVRPVGVSIASRCVEIPLVGGNGQISGVLCQYMLPSDVRGAFVSRGRGEAWAIEHVTQLVIHDINNLLAVIGSGLRLARGPERLCGPKGHSWENAAGDCARGLAELGVPRGCVGMP